MCSALGDVRFTPESVLPCFHFGFYRIRLLAYVLTYKLAGGKAAIGQRWAFRAQGHMCRAQPASRLETDFCGGIWHEPAEG